MAEDNCFIGRKGTLTFKNEKDEIFINYDYFDDDDFRNCDLESSSSDDSQNTLCENCKKCVCRSWRSKITPEVVETFEQHLNAMKLLLHMYSSSRVEIKTEESIEETSDRRIEQKTEKCSETHIELHPNTGVFIEKIALKEVIVKSNNKRAFVRNVLIKILGEEALANGVTAAKLHKQNTNMRTAIIGYLRTKYNSILTETEYTKIVNHKIFLLRQNKNLTEEEKEHKKRRGRERARKSRQLKKLDLKIFNKKPKIEVESILEHSEDS